MKESVSQVLNGYNPRTSAIFGKRQATLVTDGVFARIEMPAGRAGDRVLQTEINRLFAKAKEAGIAQPIVVGSIPFDTYRPSCLLIPQSYRFVEQDAGEMQRSETSASEKTSEQGRSFFEEKVQKLLHLFQEDGLRKVVLSRILDIDLKGQIDMPALLKYLLESSSSGYRFSIPVNDEETLVGVSPELLIRKEGMRIFCNPVAGSVPCLATGDSYEADTYLHNSEKNLHEHRLVVDQVKEVLRHYCGELSVPEGPSLLRAAFLLHLSTWIEGVLAHPQTNALEVASALHPTPAVCGYPSQEAREVISQIEGYDRGLYTGMTGWMNADGDGEWVVTIRCALLRANRARLFAGAGIVEGSIPSVEWEETSVKMAPMLHILKMASQDLQL